MFVRIRTGWAIFKECLPSLVTKVLSLRLKSRLCDAYVPTDKPLGYDHKGYDYKELAKA